MSIKNDNDQQFTNLELRLNIKISADFKAFYEKHGGIGGYIFLPIPQFHIQKTYPTSKFKNINSLIIAENGVGDFLGLFPEQNNALKYSGDMYEFVHETGEVEKVETYQIQDETFGKLTRQDFRLNRLFGSYQFDRSLYFKPLNKEILITINSKNFEIADSQKEIFQKIESHYFDIVQKISPLLNSQLRDLQLKQKINKVNCHSLLDLFSIRLRSFSSFYESKFELIFSLNDFDDYIVIADFIDFDQVEIQIQKFEEPDWFE